MLTAPLPAQASLSSGPSFKIHQLVLASSSIAIPVSSPTFQINNSELI